MSKVRGKHRLSAIPSIVLLLLGVMLVSCAVFLSLVLDKLEPEGRALITKVVLGAGLLGVGLVAWAGRLRRAGK